MSRPFTHLHVASGYSLRYGASSPAHLVETAAAHGMTRLALTDRDGLYGAVKFALACIDKGIAPVLGVDLAVEPSGFLEGVGRQRDGGSGGSGSGPGEDRKRSPVRGGATVDPRHPRVTVLALGAARAEGLEAGQGWGRLCRLVSATHLRGERGQPVSTVELITAHARTDEGAPALVVLLGPDSEFGRAALAQRADVAAVLLRRWRAVLPPGSLAVEIVHHRGPYGAPASRGHAARMLRIARQVGVPAVLTNAVRHADRDGAVTVDLLDAARRLVVLDRRHLDRTTAEGYLAGPGEMAARAAEIGEGTGDREAAATLLADTEALADRCHLDPYAELGFWLAHLPEHHVLGVDAGAAAAAAELRRRCEGRIHTRYPGAPAGAEGMIRQRLEEELALISSMEIPSYFLTIASVVDLIKEMGVRVAARGSGAGSLVNHLLGISGVDPLRHGLLMERFVTPWRAQLPDVDLDVESDRRTEVYEKILERFGADRVTCVSMMDTYRVRHAIRDAGAALGLPPGEIDTIAKAFPHIRARDVRHAIAELPELQRSGLGEARLGLLFDLVERLDGLPRHVALHPCGVIISDAGLLDRTPVEASWMGFPMSQFDKDDVEAVGLLKLDVLGIRMQSAMSYAVQEVARVDGAAAAAAGAHPEGAAYLDEEGRIDLDAVPLDDETTFRMIRTTRTLGCFQIESPGQRELIGKFGPETFHDLIVDISLFRPGPVKSDMITPFLRARQGWEEPEYVHDSLEPVLQDTAGVVVFHEQILQILRVTTGCELSEADEVRRAMGSTSGQELAEGWFRPRARARGYDAATVQRIWEVLKAFASFGFCKAHAAAFALPTYQSAWLKAHHPAAFLAGVLTHDPGMYPKRLILDDARNLGISVLPLDVNHSGAAYRVERVAAADDAWDSSWGEAATRRPDSAQGRDPDLPDGRPYGIRLALAEVKGINDAEVARIVAGRPYRSLADFWQRARVSRPVVERLVLTGAFDSVYGLTDALPVVSRDRITRRDLLLQLADLDRWSRATAVRGVKKPKKKETAAEVALIGAGAAAVGTDVRKAAARQSQAAAPHERPEEQTVQLTLELDDRPDEVLPSGLPEMTAAERVRAELEVLGLDASRHVLEFYRPMLDALGTTRACDVRDRRSRAELLVAGVKVATQTPPIRTGKRVVFLTLDDASGPIDATFFEDVQGPYAATIFHSWLLVVRGVLRKTGPRGVSLRATGAWELPVLWDAWAQGGLAAVEALLAEDDPAELTARRHPAVAGLPVNTFGGGVVPAGAAAPGRVLGVSREEGVLPGRDESDWEVASGLPSGDRASAPRRPQPQPEPAGASAAPPPPEEEETRAGGMGGGKRHRRVLVHASGYEQSPYADLKPPGEETRETRRMLAAEEEAASARNRRREPPRKLWHASPGSSGQ
jgi:error-prone DNA polymerase